MTQVVYIYEKGEKRALTQEEYDLYNSPEILLSSSREEKLTEVNLLRDKYFSNGFPFDFGDPHGIKTLDTRSPHDRTNWLGAAQLYQIQILQGNEKLLGATVRTSDNINITMTFGDAHVMLLTMGAYTGKILENSWSLKDQIKGATTQEELDAIDVTQGWPQ